MSNKIDIKEGILSKNAKIAEQLKALFKEKGVFVINIVSSPGSGKTSILEKILPVLKEKLNIFVIEGDLQTENDAQRIRKTGVPAHQITTNGACHLEAAWIEEVVNKLDLEKLDLLIIENVGNLVCPSSFYLGEDIKIVIVAATEGEDKPIKYPSMMRVSDVFVLNKIDLVPYLNFDVDRCINFAKGVNNNLIFFRTSCYTGEGLSELSDWILSKTIEKKGLNI
ncbi:MAG: hydrogenase nickel incorporation protein HypB [Calditerrivibrio sp.]|nr:hydrogenase nickel incorporation protein HypB [Calditerrivibrio sp.]